MTLGSHNPVDIQGSDQVPANGPLVTYKQHLLTVTSLSVDIVSSYIDISFAVFLLHTEPSTIVLGVET